MKPLREVSPTARSALGLLFFVLFFGAWAVATLGGFVPKTFLADPIAMLRSGWVLLAWSPRDKRLINTWAADHTMTLANGRPVLALDMYEHAYQMDYGAKAAGYVDAFMQAIRWDNAAGLFEKYSRET